jgi:hypothetical protein
MDLKTKIKQTLIEERQSKLNESFVELSDIEDKSYLVERYFTISMKLLEEGYTIEEIETADVTNGLSNINWKETIGQGALSAAKEYAIRFILKEVFGASPGFATTASQILEGLNPLDLIRPFKSEESCVQSFPNVCDRLLEALVRYLGGKQLGIDRNDYGINYKGIATSVGGNIFGELIQQSDISERISNKFCKMIH